MPVIRRIETIEGYLACEEVQRQVWGMEDGLDIVPLHMLLTVHKNGGLLLGAFEGDELVGFVFGFLGLSQEGKLKHCSHMMGVLPRWRGKGIGYRLKLAQRERVLTTGLNLVTWTYDPLESRNAYLNMHRLGCRCRVYHTNLYGSMSDDLNAGLPSDRLQVEWWLDSERVRQRVGGAHGPACPEPTDRAIVPVRTGSGLLAPGSVALDLDAEAIQVEIPSDYQSVKAADQGLALEWRLAVRQVFEAYLGAGWVAVDFLSFQTEAGRRGMYVLQAE